MLKLGLYKEVQSKEKEISCVKDLNKEFQKAIKKMDYSKAKLILVDQLKSVHELEKIVDEKKAINRHNAILLMKQQGMDVEVIRRLNYER